MQWLLCLHNFAQTHPRILPTAGMLCFHAPICILSVLMHCRFESTTHLLSFVLLLHSSHLFYRFSSTCSPLLRKRCQPCVQSCWFGSFEVILKTLVCFIYPPRMRRSMYILKGSDWFIYYDVGWFLIGLFTTGIRRSMIPDWIIYYRDSKWWFTYSQCHTF